MTIKQLKRLLRWLPKDAVIKELSFDKIVYSISEQESYKIDFPKTEKSFEKSKTVIYNIKDDKDK